MPKGKSHHVHHHFPQYTNIIVMVVIFIVGIAIGVGGKEDDPFSKVDPFEELEEAEKKHLEEEEKEKEKGDTEWDKITLSQIEKGLASAKKDLEKLESNLEKILKNPVVKTKGPFNYLVVSTRLREEINLQKLIIKKLDEMKKKAKKSGYYEIGSTGSEGNIGETGGTTGTDTSECGDYSDTSVYEGDNTVVNYRVYDNDENLVWTGSDIQTYYDEHLEKNPCGDDGENTYGWYESNGFSENICSTGPDTNPSLDPDFPLLGIPGTTVSVDEVDADGTTASGGCNPPAICLPYGSPGYERTACFLNGQQIGSC